jgi:hypothetical protein
MKRFLYEYNLDGATWGIAIDAQDATEAQRRIVAIYHNGRLQGEIFATVKVPALHSIARLAQSAIEKLKRR